MSIKNLRITIFLIIIICTIAYGTLSELNSASDYSEDKYMRQNQNDLVKNGKVEIEQEINLIGPFRVTRVVDGDTIIIDFNGVEERVRFIGIDTPESVHPDPEKNVAYGQVAAEYTKTMLEAKDVYLELDVQERDQYGSLLAYVYIGDSMFNMLLLQEGHAAVTTYPPNVKYVEVFTSLQTQARKERKGLWN